MNMEVEQHLLQGWKSSCSVAEDSEKSSSSTSFDCCICLDNACDPVVTFCGHLYCWPCIYKWLQFQGSTLSSGENTQCPVCKSEISQTSFVPLYLGGQNVSESEVDDKVASLKATVPPRPTAVAWRSKAALLARDQPLRHENSYQNMQTYPYEGSSSPAPAPALSSPGIITPAAVCDPVVGMFGEMVYARVFGNPQSLYAYPNSYYSAGSGSPRLRRQEMKIYKSLNRVSFFFFCCLLLCLLLF